MSIEQHYETLKLLLEASAPNTRGMSLRVNSEEVETEIAEALGALLDKHGALALMTGIYACVIDWCDVSEKLPDKYAHVWMHSFENLINAWVECDRPDLVQQAEQEQRDKRIARRLKSQQRRNP